jgi:hypothetical protein
VRSTLACAALVFAAGCRAPAFAWSDFEGSDEGWTLSGGSTEPRPRYQPSGGSPSGTICGAGGDQQSAIWYFVAPVGYLGNAEQAYGKRITWDLKQSSLRNPLRGRELVLQGGGLGVAYSTREVPGLNWTSYTVRLDPTAGWTLDAAGGAAPTEEDLRVILRNLTSVSFRGEFVDGPDSACLDNVYFGRAE